MQFYRAYTQSFLILTFVAASFYCVKSFAEDGNPTHKPAESSFNKTASTTGNNQESSTPSANAWSMIMITDEYVNLTFNNLAISDNSLGLAIAYKIPVINFLMENNLTVDGKVQKHSATLPLFGGGAIFGLGLNYELLKPGTGVEFEKTRASFMFLSAEMDNYKFNENGLGEKSFKMTRIGINTSDYLISVIKFLSLDTSGYVAKEYRPKNSFYVFPMLDYYITQGDANRNGVITPVDTTSLSYGLIAQVLLDPYYLYVVAKHSNDNLGSDQLTENKLFVEFLSTW